MTIALLRHYQERTVLPGTTAKRIIELAKYLVEDDVIKHTGYENFIRNKMLNAKKSVFMEQLKVGFCNLNILLQDGFFNFENRNKVQ